MNWTSIAILSAVTLAWVNVVDAHLLSKRLPGLRAFMLPLGIIHLIYGCLLFYLFPLPENIGAWPIMVAVVSGVLRTGAIAIMLYSLKSVEVSRVVPVVFTYPIIVAIVAVPLLGETLGYWQWLAIIIVVTGAVMASMRQGQFGAAIWLGKPFLLLFGSSLFFALTDITSKYALTYISFWNMFSVTAICISGSFLLVSLRPQVFRQLSNLERRNRTLALIAFNESLAPVGSVLSFWALERGPVSLVSTILSSRPIFVVMFAFIMSRILPTFLEWQPGKGLLLLRIIATVMIFGGIAIIYLS
jgi:drug/metabolite transporter (DMT)-like permease